MNSVWDGENYKVVEYGDIGFIKQLKYLLKFVFNTGYPAFILLILLPLALVVKLSQFLGVVKYE